MRRTLKERDNDTVERCRWTEEIYFLSDAANNTPKDNNLGGSYR